MLLVILVILGFKLYQSQLLFIVLCVHLNISQVIAQFSLPQGLYTFICEIKLGESYALMNRTCVVVCATSCVDVGVLECTKYFCLANFFGAAVVCL